MAEICWRVWATPANFNQFRVLASLLHRCRSTEVNKNLHGVWPSPGLVHYIYIFRALDTYGNFASCHFASMSGVLLYWQCYCTALEQRQSAKLCGMVQGMELQNFCRGRHLYSAGRPSHWALAHILVEFTMLINDHVSRHFIARSFFLFAAGVYSWCFCGFVVVVAVNILSVNKMIVNIIG